MNILPYVPVSPMLIWVMGFEAAKAGKLPTPEQHAELRRLLRRGDGCRRLRLVGPAHAADRPGGGAARP